MDDDLSEKGEQTFHSFLLDFPQYNQALIFDARDLLFPNESIPARRSVALFWDKQGRQELQTRLEPTLPLRYPLITKPLSRADDEDDGVLNLRSAIRQSGFDRHVSLLHRPENFFFLLGFHPI